MIDLTNLLLAAIAMLTLSVFIGNVFGSRGMHDNGADFTAYVMFGLGIGTLLVWFLGVLGMAIAR